ncbi:MAG: PorP/SprF family type IX secretion system membrane protein [Bacteroidetes bacterium]|nr:PorP/SprF family type IX secretion system membrane protein [Bacteroidota bacterium]
MRKIVVIACLYFFNVLSVKAQDPHFSQFFASPLTLNPAFTGKFNGNFRIAGNYRDQWPTINRAYQTSTAAIDFPILRNKIASNDIWGVGLMGYSDKSAAGAVSFNYISLSTAFHKGLDEEGYSQIGAGFQATYSNMIIDPSNLKFEDQLTPFGFTGVTSETFANSTLKSSYFDMNAGLLYTTSTTDRNNLYVGVSVYHINRPKQNFNSGAEFLINPRSTIHAGGYFGLGQNTTLHLSALYTSQAKAHETVAGGAFEFSTGDPYNPLSLYAGSWIRLNDAIIPYVGIEFNSFRLGITYDINTSVLKTASESRGGLEISLIYLNKKPDSKGVPCPKF